VKTLRFLLGATLSVIAVGAEARSITFKGGGVLQGLTAEIPDDGRPASAGYFLPGVAAPSPTSPARAERIAAALAQAAQTFKDGETGKRAIPDPKGKHAPGEDWGRFAGRLQAECEVEKPFQLNEGQARIAVVCGGRIAQFFMVTFSGEEIVNFEIIEARVPNLLPPPPAGAPTNG
jgi:hypothetical protein